MIVVVPHLAGGLRDGVLDALSPSPPGVTVRAWRLEDADYGYGRLLRDLWRSCARQRVDLAIVEQDVIVPADALARWQVCPRDWCAHSYPVFWGDVAETYGGPYALGCVRFRWQLMAEQHDLMTVALSRPEHPGKPPGHWMGLDSAVTGLLRGRRVEVHQHEPRAGHLHIYARDRSIEASPA